MVNTVYIDKEGEKKLVSIYWGVLIGKYNVIEDAYNIVKCGEGGC